MSTTLLNEPARLEGEDRKKQGKGKIRCREKKEKRRRKSKELCHKGSKKM